MPRISDKKKEKISEQILSLLFHSFPKSLFTSNIANELVRDEEFTKDLLTDLNKKDLLVPITKSSSGEIYTRRVRWRLSNKAYEAYKGRS